ncbi:MAG: DUF488 domain-containing protein, partial [Candidatus Xenobia bacterium]
MTLYTVGHSNRSWDQFLEILRQLGILRLMDVRTLPGSKRNPWFDQERMVPALKLAGIEYHWMKSLGGLRKGAAADPRNAGWENRSFRNYADYMQTAAFEAGLDELEHFPGACIMCSEAVPWRCHRSLIADAMTLRGHQVIHLMSPTSS